MRGESKDLLAVQPDGQNRMVPCTYDGIKDGLGGATLSFFPCDHRTGFWLDDNGMITAQTLNIAASIFAGYPVYGPVVLVARMPDNNGDSVPAPPEATAVLESLASRWFGVWKRAEGIGQVLEVRANPATVPPPQIVPLDLDGLFEDLLGGGDDRGPA